MWILLNTLEQGSKYMGDYCMNFAGLTELKQHKFLRNSCVLKLNVSYRVLHVCVLIYYTEIKGICTKAQCTRQYIRNV